MNVLITGGTGFCGLNIAEVLLMNNHKVVLYGISSPPAKFKNSFDHYQDKLIFVEGDVCDKSSIESSLKKYNISHIVHGAAVTAALDREKTDTDTILKVNTLGTVTVLEAAINCDIEKVITLSSGSVFGQESYDVDLDTYRIDEVIDTPVPHSIYGISKYAAERISVRYRETRGLDVLVARLGVVFGRWEYATGVRDTLSIPWQLLQLAKNNEKALIFKNYPRDWVYASDVAHALVVMLQADAGTKLSSSVYNISAGLTWSVLDWCERLKKHYPDFYFKVLDDKSTANVGIPAPTPRPSFSIDRLKNDFNFHPEFLPEQAFEDYIGWSSRIE